VEVQAVKSPGPDTHLGMRWLLQVAEMTTDNELLKERLADAKRDFQTATAGEAAASEAAAALQAR
jgi:hypothetical protein